MRAVFTIAERELRALITAPLGYVVMMFFLFVASIFFLAPLQQQVGHLRFLISNVVVWLVFLLPALTMRLIAEEKKQGTIELLMTSPVTETQVVLGKYFGVLGYYLLMLFATLPYVLVLGMVRKSDANPIFPTYVGIGLTAATLVLLTVAAIQESRALGFMAALTGFATLVCSGFAAAQMGEWGPALTGYLGLIMLGAVFLAIGVMASGLTRNQIIAWVSTAAVLLFLMFLIQWVTNDAVPAAPELEANAGFTAYLSFAWGWVKYALLQVLSAINLRTYLENFAQGVLDLRDFVLYLSLIAVSLFFAIRGLTTSRAS
jgi:ABC-2 type transport system permease protein